MLRSQLLRGLITRLDFRRPPDAHGQLKARVHFIGARREAARMIRVINRGSRGLVEGTLMREGWRPDMELVEHGGYFNLDRIRETGVPGATE